MVTGKRARRCLAVGLWAASGLLACASSPEPPPHSPTTSPHPESEVKWNGREVPGRYVDAVLSASGDEIVLLDASGTVTVRATADLRVTGSARTGATAAGLSPHGSRVVQFEMVEDYRSDLQVWDSRTGKSLLNLERAHSSLPLQPEYSHDESTMVTAGAEGSPRVWNLRDGTQRANWDTDAAMLHYMGLSRDGKLLATMGEGQEAEHFVVWDVATQTRRFAVPKDYTIPLFSWDSKWLVARPLEDGPPAVFDATSGKRVRLMSEVGVAVAAQFGPGAKLLLVAKSGEISIWNTELWMRVKSPQLHGTAAAFSADGKWLAIEGKGRPARLVSLTDGKSHALSLRPGHTSTVLSIRTTAVLTKEKRQSGEDDERIVVWTR